MRVLMAVLCLALAGSVAAQERTEQSTERLRLINADEATGSMQQGVMVRTLIGNVHFVHGGRTIRCRRARYFENDSRWVLTGAVQIVDSVKSLFADEVTYREAARAYEAEGNVKFVRGATELTSGKLYYFSGDRRGLARDNVVIVNSEERVRLTGGRAEYFRDADSTVFTQSPVFVQFDSSGREETRIVGKRMRSAEGGERVRVEEDVRIYHKDVRAECRQALFLNTEDKIVLTETPVAWQGPNKLEGEIIELHLTGRKIREVHVLEKAKATLLADTTIANQRPSTLTGQKLVAYLGDDELDRVIVNGTATLNYHVYENGKYKGLSFSQSDDMTLFLDGNSVQRVLQRSDPGKSTGKFTPPGMGETRSAGTAAPAASDTTAQKGALP